MRSTMFSLFVAIAAACFIAPGLVWTADAPDLQTRVQRAIENHHHTAFEDTQYPIHVTTTKDGRVILEGQTNTLFDKYRIFDIVSKVAGVTEISNQLAVQTRILPNDIIKNNIQEEMKYNRSLVEHDRINVAVDNGLVILTGKVSYNYEKKLAQTIASWHEGVRGIDNKITVMPATKALSDANLKQVLNEILTDQFPTDTNNVTFSVDKGKVVLNGKVDNMWSKRNIEQEFRDVIGVIDVQNGLKVMS